MANIEARLAQIEELLQLAEVKAQATEEWARATKEWATSTTTQVVEYKDSDDFENDAAKIGRDVYFIRFANYKKKVAQVCPALDLSTILVPREEEGVEEGKEEVDY